MNTNFLQINYDINNNLTNLTFVCSHCGTQNELSLDGLVSIKNIQSGLASKNQLSPQLNFMCSNLDCGFIYDFDSFSILVKIDGISDNNPYKNYVNVTEFNQVTEIDNLLNSNKKTKSKLVDNKELILIDNFVKKNDIHPHNTDAINVIKVLIWAWGLVLAGCLFFAGVALMKSDACAAFITILFAGLQIGVTWCIASLVNLVKQYFFVNLVQMDYLKIIANNSLTNNSNE